MASTIELVVERSVSRWLDSNPGGKDMRQYDKPKSGSEWLRQSRERGYVLITMALAAAAMFGVLGLAVDVGRMYIAKSETQAFCDSAALSATLQLNGTSNGITAAKNAVSNNLNPWNLDSAKVATFSVDFATSA